MSPDDEKDDAEDVTPARTFGHFEIVCGDDGWPVQLGRGAMGTTYRARDTVLRTEVALKVIGVNVAGHPAARTAFLREARAAAKLHHANVAGVFHYGEQDGECFYAMELVEGETLEARLRRAGPLPAALVLEVGRQVACALMEAEALGIVHRDLKPSNVMFATRRGDGANDPPHIKVIDFGLAQAVDLADAEDDDKAATEGFIGTPSFASPEQFARDVARPVDTRSDIYSLGVTMWYLLCGELPFGGSTLTGVHEQQVRQPLRLKQLYAARVPPPVVMLLQQMLKADPGERFSSARSLVDALAECQNRISSGRRWNPRKWFILASILLIIGLAGWRAIHPVGPKMPTARPTLPPWSRSLAVLPFENLDPGGKADYFSDGVQREIAFDLRRIAAIKVVSLGDSRDYPPNPRNYQTIGRELGVDHLLEGAVRRQNGKVSVQLRLVDVHAPETSWRVEDEQPLARACESQARLVRGVAGRLSVEPTSEEGRLIDKPMTTNAEAYDFYLQSFAGPQTLRGTKEMRDYQRYVLDKLERAVALDPNFVRAYCKIAREHDNFTSSLGGATPEELAVDHRTLAEVALQSARQLDPDSGEVHFAYAWHFHYTSRNSRQALIEAELAERTLPNDSDLHSLIGVVARRQGRWDDAIRQLQKAAELSPRTAHHFYDLSETCRAMRRYAEADRACARHNAILPESEVTVYRMLRTVIPLEESGDLEPMRTALATVEPAKDPDAEIRETFGIFIALCSHDADALSRIVETTRQSALGFGGWDYPKAWYSALAARMRGDAASARSAFTLAREEMAKEAVVDPGNARVLCALAMIDAGLGRKDEAISEAKRACDMTPYSVSAASAPEMVSCLAIVYAWTDEPNLALALLDDLVGKPAGRNLWYSPTYGDLKLSPVWDPLRSDPRFAPLMERLAPRPPQ